MKADNHEMLGLRLSDLEQASNFFRFFAEKVNAVFWVRDDTCNKQLYLSPGFEKVWGRKREFLYQNPNNWIDTLHPEDRAKFNNSERFKALEEAGPAAKYEYRYRIYTPEGELRWIKDTSFPITDEKSNFIGFAGVAEEITKEVYHELELREAKSRAEVANQAKSDFLAMISHELRTPLNAILGMTQILKNKGLPDGLMDHVNIISSAGTSLLSLVSDILDFARLEAGKLSFFNEPFDINILMTQIVHSMQYLAREKNVELRLEAAPNLPHAVIGDANRVRQVLVNLIGNAIKFTEQGYVQINIHHTEVSPIEARFHVSIKDTGIGIKEEKLKTIFEKFSQIDSIYQRKHRGIGLGLAISKQLIETMGGEVSVVSKVGEGSTFSFELNLQLQSEPVDGVVPIINPEAVVTYQKYEMKILVVEDNLINQKIAKLILEDFGCTVDLIENGQEVLERISELASYDLIFMDVGLPDMSGFEIVQKLRLEPTLQTKPIVAMTAHILEHDRQQAFDSGMNRIVAKPISYHEIAATLDMYAVREVG